MSTDLYLDYNGSTPLHPAVLALARELLEADFGNPSAPHAEGRRARSRIDRARTVAAAAIGAATDEIWFTSGGSESNNWALLASARHARGRHFVVSAVEHKSVLASADELVRQGFERSILPVGEDGAVRVADVERVLRPDTFLVSVMCANNETGVLQPVRAIGELCRARGVRFHTDAVTALGKLPLDVRTLQCDLLSLSSHKLYAPKGVGLLWVRRGVELPALIHGCGQQQGLRSGTENTLGVVAFARALELLRAGELVPDHPTGALRDQLWAELQRRFPGCIRNGAGEFLPNTLNVAFPGALGATLQDALARSGISVTAGAAGSGGAPSHVLMAMGLGEERARSSLRFSLGLRTSPATLERLVEELERALRSTARASQAGAA